ncbi:hypothetical protein BX666DRAFT_1856559 [Dichotomocladium elegans]|nr:hypothetical protein BX666DRAFT_1856559 [Dichotomocladium elegans]
MVSRAAKTKVKKNKKKQSIPESEDEDEPAPPPPAVDEELDEEDDWYNQGPKKNNKKNKKGGAAASTAATAAPSSLAVSEEPQRILTKKEKEKLKKEREKEAKRLAAIEKKKKEAEEEAELNKLAAANGHNVEEKSKAQQKKEKTAASTQKKKEKQAQPPPEPVAAPAPAGAKGKKKGPAGLAALRKQLEAQKAAEEEAKRKEEEERQRRLEEEKKRKEEEKAIKEQLRLKREKAKAKKEQLKQEGKYLTKAQKEAQRRAKLRTEQLLASGHIKIAAFEEKEDSAESTESGQKKKRIIYESKKKRKGPSKEELEAKQREEEERKRKEEEEKKRQEAEAQAKAQAQEEEELCIASEDDWEKAADSSDEEVGTKKDEKENLKDEWDDSSEDEDEGKKETEEKESEGKAATKPASDNDSEEDSDDDESWDEDDSDEELTNAQKAALKRKEEAAARRAQRTKEAMAARSKDDLRSPICCILGHVDTGKTKLLDKIRQTNVQEGEAGGITQQIGATYFPAEAIEKKTAILGKDRAESLKVPGLLIIDTPGHESFTNLRSRGSSLCNIAILVVDIMHGLEQQTLESIRLLRDRRTPFIVALNKIDRLFQWQATPNNGFQASLAKQKKSVKQEFETRVEKTILAFAEQGLNAALYYKNPNQSKYVSLVPTSAITGEGVPDMLNLLVNLTQTRMTEKLMYITELECTVLEVKVIEGLGTTIDVVLVNGYLHEGDKIVLCGLNGPIVTQVRALLTPQPMRELRIKSQYVHHKEVKAALGVKIAAPDLEKAIAGSRLLVCGPDDDEEDLKEEVMSDLTNLMNSIDRQGKGVWVQASTLGSLEALLEFLRSMKIPVFGINIGPVHRKDVVKAGVMLEKAKEYAVMLCFDVKVEKEAEEMAEELGIKVFKADIIYHLFDRFVEYSNAMVEQKRREQADQAVFPVILKMVPRAIYNKKNPIVMGVDVIEGSLRIGTPICVVRPNAEGVREVIPLGKVTSMEQNHKPVEVVKKGASGGGVAIKIEGEPTKTFGRHFEETDEYYSKISRTSIDVLKESFRKDMSKEDWALVVKLKKILGVD